MGVQAELDLKNRSYSFLSGKIVVQLFGMIGIPQVHSSNIVASVFDVLDIIVKRGAADGVGVYTHLSTQSNDINRQGLNHLVVPGLVLIT